MTVHLQKSAVRLIGLVFFPVWIAGASGDYKGYLILHGPRLVRTASDESLDFRWDFRHEPDTLPVSIYRYEIQFWSKWKQFFKTYVVSPEDPTDRGFFTLESYRDVFRRHGRYYWRVQAFDEDQKTTASDIRSFMVPVPNLRQRLADWIYPYRLYMEYTHRLRSTQYMNFLQGVSPRLHLRSYSEIGLGFRQVFWPERMFECQEQVYLLSHVGMGFTVSTGFLIHKNTYLALIPRVQGEMGWFSTGLGTFDSRQEAVSFGADFALMPRGYVVIKIAYSPMHRVRYQLASGGVRTYDGKGWEWGMRFFIPRTVIDLFKLAGMEFDFQKMPFEFSMASVRDAYTRTTMRIRRLTVHYLFH